jgi:hypothetical protein
VILKKTNPRGQSMNPRKTNPRIIGEWRILEGFDNCFDYNAACKRSLQKEI